MAKKPKLKTNDKALKNLIKALNWEHPIMFAILRERVLMIADLTEQSIKNHPEKWNNQIIHPDLYLKLNSIIRRELEFDKDDPKTSGEIMTVKS